MYYCDEYREGQNYYMTKIQRIEEMKNAIPASFKSLNNGYGKDARHAFFCGKSFAVKDVSTLIRLDRNFSKDNVQAYVVGN